MTTKVLIAALLLVAIVMPAYAVPKSQTGGGPKVGLTVSKWSGDDVDEFGDLLAWGMNQQSGFEGWHFSSKYRYGLSIGGFIRHDVSPRFSIQPEFLYSFKGHKFDGGGYYEGYPVDMTMTYKTNYLEIPVLGILSTADARRNGLDLLLGPYLAVKVSSKLSVKAEVLGQSEEESTDLDYIKSFDLGLIVGAGFHLASGVIADARYGLGLVTVFDQEGSPEVKNRGFVVSAGFRF
ncbi:MAG: porin family protein [bacterium]